MFALVSNGYLPEFYGWVGSIFKLFPPDEFWHAIGIANDNLGLEVRWVE